MKYFVTILTTLCFLHFTGNAQVSKFQIGVDGGPSISSQIVSEELVSLESVVGYSYALNFQLNFTNHLAFVSGIGFEQKSSQTKDEIFQLSPVGNVTGSFKLRNSYNFLNIPLMVRYTVGKNNFQGFVNVGGYLGFLMSHSATVVDGEQKTPFSDPAKTNLQEMDFGVTAGIGMAYSITERIAVTFEVRDNYGEKKLNSINFLLGFKYGFGTKM